MKVLPPPWCRPALWALAALLAGGFTALAIAAALVTRLPGDLAASLWVQGWATPWLDQAALVLRALAAVLGVVIILGGLALTLALLRRWREATLAVATLAASALTLVLKLLIGRPRPAAPDLRVLEQASSLSFPSGHASSIVLICGLLAYLVARHVRSRGLRWGAYGLLAALVIAMGASRIYLGVHWLSDVLGGYLLGGFLLLVLLAGFHRWLPSASERRADR